MPFTESVRSFHVPATPGTFAWPPSTSLRSYFARNSRYFVRK